ncbi:interferon phi 2 [Mugil cephalus]|uniref:interferon phi 2 n=1 Tax=Mugil cephalus TaxID=48193 RepID=UPI001FB5A212|nr:interferon phi 2 [Mugil cephalus]
MTTSFVLFILLHLCSVQLTVVAMPTCQMLGKVAENALHLLRDLAGPFPIECLQYNANISFPDTAVPESRSSDDQCHQALWALFESLRGAELIFQEYDLPVGTTWDKKKLDNFLNLQNRLVKAGSCLSSVNDSSAISSYFTNVTAVIEDQDSASCGWMAMRRDLLRVMKSTLQRHETCFSWRQVRHLG